MAKKTKKVTPPAEWLYEMRNIAMECSRITKGIESVMFYRLAIDADHLGGIAQLREVRQYVPPAVDPDPAGKKKSLEDHS